MHYEMTERIIQRENVYKSIKNILLKMDTTKNTKKCYF